MYPASFEYHRASTIEEVLNTFVAYPEAKVIAGGASLLPMMKLRLVRPSHVIDIGSVEELCQMERTNDSWLIGAATKYIDVIQNPHIAHELPLLTEALSSVGDVQVRNMGTIGGSLAHADPSGDSAPALIALRATIHVVGPDGTRQIPADQFIVDPYTSVLGAGEIISGIEIPLRQPDGFSHQKFEQRTGDFAVVNVSCMLSADEIGTITAVSMGIGGAGLVPIRATHIERLLLNSPLDEEAIQQMTHDTISGMDMVDDIRGSAWYRAELARTLIARAVVVAARRASEKN